MAITLNQVVPWGRTLDEYRHLFDLTADDLEKRIVGVADGPASFNAEMHALGRRVISVDPLYAFTAEQIAERVHDTWRNMVDQLWNDLDDYVWTRFATPNQLGQHRLHAMQTFGADLPLGLAQGRYVVGELPQLDFGDDLFDIALCSHFLFLYSAQLSGDFHVAALLEMARIAAEVRVFPLLDLNCQPSVHIAPVSAALQAAGLTVEIQPVPYEFQRGGNQMMRISRT